MPISFRFLFVAFLLFAQTFASADEGMWFPQLLQKLNAAEMRLRGLKVPVEEIYSLNKNSMKDAVVLFGGGCTGEIISPKGLLLTNHHCGYDQIQEHSTVEKNYLRDGFWATSLKDEIPCKGLTATFVIRIDEVTGEFSKELAGVSEADRAQKIKEISARLEKKAVEGTSYEARVRQFYMGNEFYLITTETFRDIRMVGAPPSSIGKFGGDTDNWMWPRHTGDFSLFRVYAGKDNAPADYSPDNVPYKPRHHFPISLKGVQPEDFTMVYGFPGRTQQYISGYQLETILGLTNPTRIRIRDERLRIMGEAMRGSEAVHLQYAAKQSGVSNAWKKWKGESRGLEAADALSRKRYAEDDFRKWCLADEARNRKYGQVLPSLEKLFQNGRPYFSAGDHYNEAAFAVELISWASSWKELVDLSRKSPVDTARMGKEFRKQRDGMADFYKDYHVPTDRTLMTGLLRMYSEGVPDSLKPAYFTDMLRRYKGDFTRLADALYKGSIVDDHEQMKRLCAKSPSSVASKISGDPAFRLADELVTFYRSRIAPRLNSLNSELAVLNRLYMEGQREMLPDKKFYPDANSTLRVAFGQVRGYEPRDAVYYHYQTTLDGLMEKYIPGDEEFDLPKRLVDLYRKKDYGPYAVNGTVPVAFIATNHTTGGNSGSPVLNDMGHLIGTNYDRVWEGTMSDILFNPEICRNITLDIRYTLFIIDKFAGAKRLISELELIR